MGSLGASAGKSKLAEQWSIKCISMPNIATSFQRATLSDELASRQWASPIAMCVEVELACRRIKSERESESELSSGKEHWRWLRSNLNQVGQPVDYGFHGDYYCNVDSDDDDYYYYFYSAG